LLLQHQAAGDVHGFILDREHPDATFTIGAYSVHVSLDSIFGSHTESGYGLVMATGPDEFLGVGKGFRVLITAPGQSKNKLGIGAIDEGTFEDGKWIPGRRLNGDENDQGAYWRFDPRKVNIEKVKLYRYE